jgi:hypothetical protein
MYLSIYLTIYLSIYLSIYLPTYLSIAIHSPKYTTMKQKHTSVTTELQTFGWPTVYSGCPKGRSPAVPAIRPAPHSTKSPQTWTTWRHTLYPACRPSLKWETLKDEGMFVIYGWHHCWHCTRHNCDLAMSTDCTSAHEVLRKCDQLVVTQTASTSQRHTHFPFKLRFESSSLQLPLQQTMQHSQPHTHTHTHTHSFNPHQDLLTSKQYLMQSNFIHINVNSRPL